METDQEFFNKPKCPRCGSPEVYPCSYCTPVKEYNEAVRKMKIDKITAIFICALFPVYVSKNWRREK
jgi:hypothetical protein